MESIAGASQVLKEPDSGFYCGSPNEPITVSSSLRSNPSTVQSWSHQVASLVYRCTRLLELMGVLAYLQRCYCTFSDHVCPRVADVGLGAKSPRLGKDQGARQPHASPDPNVASPSPLFLLTEDLSTGSPSTLGTIISTIAKGSCIPSCPSPLWSLVLAGAKPWFTSYGSIVTTVMLARANGASDTATSLGCH